MKQSDFEDRLDALYDKFTLSCGCLLTASPTLKLKPGDPDWCEDHGDVIIQQRGWSLVTN